MNRFQSLAAILLLTLLCVAPCRAENLKLLISVQQQNIAVPNPVRATLHFHNSGQRTLWLYRPVVSKMASDQYAVGTNGRRPGLPYGGSALEVQLVTVNPPGSEKKQPAGSGFVLAPDALPFPRLVRVAPGEDYDERVTLHVEPGSTTAGAGNQPDWGQYRFSVNYSADYSNAEALARDIDATLWHGQVSSNSITLNLQPPTAQGSIAGTVVGSAGRPYDGALITLSDENENALDQLYSDDGGRFSFTHFPPGRYWVTVRQPGSDRDTSVFRHIDLNQPGSPATAEIMLLPAEADKADRILHKPVLFRIVDNQGHPLAKVRLAILSSTGTLIENHRAQTREDGFAAISLMPGPIFVTLQMQGCKKEERRADVSYGPGVDGFKYVFDCAGK